MFGKATGKKSTAQKSNATPAYTSTLDYSSAEPITGSQEPGTFWRQPEFPGAEDERAPFATATAGAPFASAPLDAAPFASGPAPAPFASPSPGESAGGSADPYAFAPAGRTGAGEKKD